MRNPHPAGETLQALDGLGLTDLAVLHRAEESKQLIELDLVDVHIVEEMAGKRLEVLGRLRTTAGRYWGRPRTPAPCPGYLGLRPGTR